MQGELKIIEGMENDDRWFNINFDSIQKSHENEFVVISKRKIVVHDKNIEKVFEKIRKVGIDSKNVLIEFIPERGLVVIL